MSEPLPTPAAPAAWPSVPKGSPLTARLSLGQRLAELLIVGLLRGAIFVSASASQRWQRPLLEALSQRSAASPWRSQTANKTTESACAAVGDDQLHRQTSEGLQVLVEQLVQLQRLAQIDSLTGVALRSHFLHRLQQHLTDPAGTRAALLLVRIPDVETLNLRCGRQAVDQLLQAVAAALLTYVDQVAGSFAGRLNGGEFALCLPVLGVAQETAESLHKALTTMPAMRSADAVVLIGGIDGLPPADTGAAMAAADSMLASAENGTGSGVAVAQQRSNLFDGAGGAHAWRVQISAALGSGRVRLAEVPVLDRSGTILHRVCTLELQIKVNGQFELAAQWLALARRSRLLPQVDLVTLDRAIRAIERDGQSRAIRVHSLSLSEPDFIADVNSLLLAAPAASHYLLVEIDDLAAHSSLAWAAASRAWHPRGLRLGIEHRSASPEHLGSLQAMGIDYFRLNERLLKGLAMDAAAHAYVQSLVALVHGLGMKAYSAGITQADDLFALWALGLDGAAGVELGST